MQSQADHSPKDDDSHYFTQGVRIDYSPIRLTILNSLQEGLHMHVAISRVTEPVSH